MATLKSFKGSVGEFEYSITRKRVKNVNLRVRRDGSVTVSAPSYVPESFILEFVELNAERILKIIAERPKTASPSEEQNKIYSHDDEQKFLEKATAICRSVEPLFFGKARQSPKIELCHGISRWGYYMPRRNLIRLNIRLSEYPDECLRYVIMHEYCHTIVQNHSASFYAELQKRMPNWKSLKKRLSKAP